MLGSCIQCLWVWSLSFTVLQMCVWSVHTRCVHAYTKLTFCLHHTWHMQLFCLHCTLLWLFCHKTYLLSSSWLWLVWTNSRVFTPQGNGPVGTMVLIMPGLHRIQTITSMDTCQVREYRNSTIFMVLTILKWQVTRAAEPGEIGRL